MRIAQVLTYVSTDGAYGGPLAVMVAHCRELAVRGHDVEIFAGWDGHAELVIPGVRVNLFRVRRLTPRGFSGLLSPALVWTLGRRAAEFDVIHVHLSRDLVTAPAALRVLLGRARPKVFAQTHGMIKPDARLPARVVDVGIRFILRRCVSVLALNRVDAERLRQVGGDRVSIVELPNGVAAQDELHQPTRQPPEFLFLARLQPRKRVLLFAQAVEAIHASTRARFAVVGPDEGDLAELQSYIAAHGLSEVLRYEGALAPGEAPRRLRQSDVFVLPSLNEPFPMTVLEAMSVGIGCIIASSCHIAERLEALGGVVTFDGGAAELSSVMSLLASDHERREALGRQAARTVAEVFDIKPVVDTLTNYYSVDRRARQRVTISS